MNLSKLALCSGAQIAAFAVSSLSLSAQITISFEEEGEGSASILNVVGGTNVLPVTSIVGTGEGETWGITGGTFFTNSKLVDYSGEVTTTPPVFNADGRGVGLNSEDSAGGKGDMKSMLDGQEAFTWTVDKSLELEGLVFRSWGGAANSRKVTLSSTSWGGLVDLELGVGITYTDHTSSGTFTLTNPKKNAVNGGVDLTDLGGTPLSFTDITLTNVLGNNALKHMIVSSVYVP